MRAGSAAAFIFFKGLLGAASVLPNCRRTLRVPLSGYAGYFRDFTGSMEDVCTFDLSPLLDCCRAGELIADASVAISLVGPPSALDPAPQSHQIGAIGISGAEVSIRLGAWLASVPYAMYRLEVTAETTGDNTLEGWAYARVYNPIS